MGQPEVVRCPMCGGPAKVLHQTVMRDGIREPVEPYISCPSGHVTLVRGPDRQPVGPDMRQATDDPELIG